MNKQERLARAAWTAISEPCDHASVALLATVGAEKALAILNGKAQLDATETELLEESISVSELEAGLQRWTPRRHAADDAEAMLATARRFHGGLLIPGDELWPEGLQDLANPPMALWFRGNIEKALPGTNRTLSLVGSRDATEYGRQITSQLATAAVEYGHTVLSGGAYGIDARAHEAAMTATRPTADNAATTAIVAGGIDRFYPAGNDELLYRITMYSAMVSECAPGSAPTRWRFLGRNRLLAALAGATIVPEARWRSGALTTARGAHDLGRQVGAVPGSSFSANSRGTHRLIREGVAKLVSDSADMLELLS